MGDLKRRKISHGKDLSEKKIKKQQQEEEPQESSSASAADDASSEEESATLDVPSNEEDTKETPKTFAELVRILFNDLIWYSLLLTTCRVSRIHYAKPAKPSTTNTRPRSKKSPSPSP